MSYVCLVFCKQCAIKTWTSTRKELGTCRHKKRRRTNSAQILRIFASKTPSSARLDLNLHEALTTRSGSRRIQIWTYIFFSQSLVKVKLVVPSTRLRCPTLSANSNYLLYNLIGSFEGPYLQRLARLLHFVKVWDKWIEHNSGRGINPHWKSINQALISSKYDYWKQ